MKFIYDEKIDFLMKTHFLLALKSTSLDNVHQSGVVVCFDYFFFVRNSMCMSLIVFICQIEQHESVNVIDLIPE